MWEEFTNMFGGGGDNSGFGIAQSSNAYNSVQNPQAGFGLGNIYTPSTSWGQSAMGSNSPQSTIGSNPYQAQSPDWFSMGGAFGNGQTGGWVSPALQGLQSLFSWTQGNKAMDLARDQFNFNKEITQKNLANQTSLLNTSMRDRQNARRAASSSYQDTDSYMREHGL